MITTGIQDRIVASTGQQKTLIFSHNGGVLVGKLFLGNGGLPPLLIVPCLSCGRDLQLPPEKGVTVERFAPKQITINGRPVMMTTRVSVRELFVCSHPALNGKGECGTRMKLTDGVLSKG